MDRETVISHFLEPRNVLLIHIIVGLVLAIAILPEPPFTGYNDPANIVRRATAVAQGTSPFAYPDPPLRYLPISAFIILTSPLDISPSWITLMFTILVEFVVMPITYYLMLKDWISGFKLSITMYISAMLIFNTYPWANTALQMSSWMYAYPLPFVFLSFNYANRRDSKANIIAGILLGIVAMFQFFIAAVAAITVALIRWQSPRSVVRIAIASIVTSSPLLIYFINYSSYFINASTQRAVGSPSISILENITIVTFVVILIVIIYLYNKHPTILSYFEVPYPIIVYFVVTVGGTVIFSLLDSHWMRVIMSYMSKFSIYPVVAITFIGIYRISKNQTVRNKLGRFL